MINECESEIKTIQVQKPYDLAKFIPIKILNNNSKCKVVSVLGHFSDLSDEQVAILILEKTAFSVEQLTTGEQTFFTQKSNLKTEFLNDIYGNFLCFTDPEINYLKTTIIYPATEKHISKFSEQNIFIFEESPEAYKNITLPHIDKEQFTLDWVFNILDHKKEKERIVFEDPCNENGFILVPDLKWDGKTVETIYLIAIIRQRGIKSLRDLNEKHLPLLSNIQEKGIQAIKDKYSIDKDQLRIYFHYQPSFYHLHVHFTYLKHDAPGIYCEKSHLLSTVINNIRLMSDYYQKSTLSFTVTETDRLYDKFKEEFSTNKKFKAE